MKAEETLFPKSLQKAKKHKKKHQKYRFLKFDKEGFLIAMGFGIVSSAIGVLLIWSSKNTPDDVSVSETFSYLKGLNPILPDSLHDTILFLLGNLLLLFGLISLLAGIRIFAGFLSFKLKK